ncbi:MAG: RNA ligase family protein, partial [Cetobacterium sp.]
YIFYGEWVVRHKINYTAEIANTFVLFDIYNAEEDKYLNPVSVEIIAEKTGLKTPKKLYYGEYISLKHLEQFVGVGEHCDKGEGIVIRNWSNSTMCKWVREDFREERPVKQPKEHDSIVVELFEALCTEARIEKVLHKGLDEGIYKSFDQSNFGKMMGYCSNAVVADAIKENSEVIPVDKLDEFVKYSKKRIPNVVKEILCKMGE